MRPKRHRCREVDDMSKIIFLGTACGRPTAQRFNSSTAIEHKGEIVLIDAGAPCTALLKKQGLSPGDITNIFITHLHSDHVYGLPMLLREIVKSRNNGESKMDAELGIDLFIPDEANPGIMTAVDILSGGNRSGSLKEYVRLHSLLDKAPVKRENFTVTPHYNRNDGFESYAFFTETAERRILFTGDLPGNFDVIAPLLKDLDILVAEAAHLDFPAYSMLNNKSINKIIISHIRWIYHTKEHELIQQLEKQMPDMDIVLAYDGMEVEL